MTTSTYWAGKGKHQEKYDILDQQIPDEGSCAVSVPELEALRVITNIYKDLYINRGGIHIDEIIAAAGVCASVNENIIIDDDFVVVAAALELKVDDAVVLAWGEHREVTAHSTH